MRGGAVHVRPERHGSDESGAPSGLPGDSGGPVDFQPSAAMDPRPDLRIPPLGADGVYSVPDVFQKPAEAAGGKPEIHELGLENPEQRCRGQGPPGGQGA